MPTNAIAPQSPAAQSAAALLLEGRVVEASQILAEALSHSDSSDLWNDWAVVQLHLAELGFRRALQGDPSQADVATNLGLVLFCIGKRAEAAVFLEKSLANATGAIRAHIQALLDLCRSKSCVTPADREAVRRQILSVLEEYFLKHNRAEDVVAPKGVDLRDPQPQWIEENLNQGSVHDEDYLVFGAFQDPETTILDIGAHFGYSVASIWASGAASRIISFEANQRFEQCLRHIANLRPGRYDYRITALGDSPGVLHFTMPVLNGVGLGALATACATPDLPSLAQNVLDHFEKFCSGQPFTSFRIYAFEAPVARLDDQLAAGGFSVPTDRIVAVKIDTEGHEAHVLSGCPSLLATQRPLILAEGGHSNSAVCRQLLQLGYVYARRTSRHLQMVSAPTTAINGFFLHRDQAEEYRQIGLLQP